jgi:replicative superfamily II helicase
LKAVSDRWVGAENLVPITFRHLVLPESASPHTDLLDLQPLPITALQNEELEALYAQKFAHFNPIQTQVFHSLYHTDQNVLLGAPTSSGKTICAELAIFGAFNRRPGCKCVYIAPLKALVRERVLDWQVRFGEQLNKRVVELTGDATPDVKTILESDLIITSMLIT